MGKILLPTLLGGFGLGVVVIAVIAGWFVVPNIIDSKIEEEVSLVNGSDTWKKWVNNPVPVYLNLYIFHVNNPDQVEEGSKPILREYGPYVYEETRNKIDVTINKEDDTITYRQPIRYNFRKDLSSGRSDEDEYDIINGAFIAISTVIFSKQGPGGAPLIDGLVSAGETIVRRRVKVKDMLFDGYSLIVNYIDILRLSGDPIPPEFEDFRFGFYRGRNNSDDGVYTIKGGIKDSNDFGKIIKWQNKTQLDWWYPPVWKVPQEEQPENTYCNMINGTDGTIFPPFIKKDTVVYNFISDVCRSAYLVYKNDIEHLGISGYKFGFADEFYQDPMINGDNYCFCPSPANGLKNTCSAGVIRIFPCKSKGPIVTSSPHFLHADEKLRDYISGINPIEEKHETYVELEPNSGHMLRISKKVQINVEIQALPTIKYFENFENYLFPAFWADENVELDKHYADDLKSKLLNPMKAVNISKWTVLGAGIALVLVSGVILIIRR